MHTKLHTQTRGAIIRIWWLRRGYSEAKDQQRPIFHGHYLIDEEEGQIFVRDWDGCLWKAPLDTPIPKGIEPM